MSTSLLYHAWGLRGYRHVHTDYVDGTIRFAIEQDPATFRCANCGSCHVVRAGVVPRRFRTLPVGGKPVFIDLPVQRLWCATCACTRQAAVRFADARRTYTRAFERYVLELSGHMTIKGVAEHLGVGWDVVKDIQKRHLHRRFRKPKLKRLKHIAIDEIHVGGRTGYLTVVLDLDTGAIVFVGRGKGTEALDPFWKRLRGSGARVKAVATDMSAAYTAAVAEHLPKATHVFDRFHVVKLFNERLSDLRRDVQREAEDHLHKAVLKGTRWLLLKNPENLDDEKDERRRLAEALALNKPLATAYYLKEDLRQQLWAQPGKRQAGRFLDDWVARARCSGIRMLQQILPGQGSPRPSSLTAAASSPTTTARSPPPPWRVPTTRSARCSGRRTAFATRSSSNSSSTPYMRLPTL